MNNFGDNLLSIVGRFSGRLGPITALIDVIVDRIAPKAFAQASCPPSGSWVCRSGCGACCRNCSGDYSSYIIYFYTSVGCPTITGNCNTGICTYC